MKNKEIMLKLVNNLALCMEGVVQIICRLDDIEERQEMILAALAAQQGRRRKGPEIPEWVNGKKKKGGVHGKQ